ncbi:hypothetical protein CL55_00004080 [Polynucleobacter duraquae]|jgi:hypothetical protein|uniref:Uncharacterized protein n=1 Tax=Polynucleobacter duraquae TaxID=1835254 RepID=A0A0E3ZKA6_9BURK|nr:hypothetical protein [Polynucleobacter duraquae]AKD24741.1 hypothetical protein CL55_00004080 [Polynucleobacter duraquae]
MTPDTTNRQKSYAHIAKLLESASKSYENAALGLEQGGSEEQAYQHIKKARITLEAALPEFFTPHKPLPTNKIVPEKRDYSILKIGLIAGLIVGVLYIFVVYGPTGDLSKSWNTENFQKNVAYPK